MTTTSIVKKEQEGNQTIDSTVAQLHELLKKMKNGVILTFFLVGTVTALLGDEVDFVMVLLCVVWILCFLTTDDTKLLLDTCLTSLP